MVEYTSCRPFDFLLSGFGDADAAKRLFRKALGDPSHRQPRVINTDLAPIYSSAIPDSKKEGALRNCCRHRPAQYLNNIREQDHRAIKRRVNAKQGLREFQPSSGSGSTSSPCPMRRSLPLSFAAHMSPVEESLQYSRACVSCAEL
jgi:transposase-like protein